MNSVGGSKGSSGTPDCFTPCCPTLEQHRKQRTNPAILRRDYDVELVWVDEEREARQDKVLGVPIRSFFHRPRLPSTDHKMGAVPNSPFVGAVKGVIESLHWTDGYWSHG